MRLFDAFYLVMQRTPVSVYPHYGMIARRVERRDALRSSMGHNALNTPCRAGYQGKCPWILGHQAKLPEKGAK